MKPELSNEDALDWTKYRPPAYLLGTTIAVWGVLADHPVLGVIVGLLLECHHWVKWRWRFSDQDFIRVWNLCVVLFLTVGVFQVVDRDFGHWRITRVLQVWMPLLLFPMVWAQYFTRGPDVSLLTFSLVARRKRLFDERAGRRLKEPRRAHIGYFYFAALLLSIGAVGKDADSLGELLKMKSHHRGVGGVHSVYVIVAFLLAWALSAFVARRRWTLAAGLLLVAALVGHHLHHGLQYLHGIVETKTMAWITGRHSGDPDGTETEFGKVGELKLSPKVFWRASFVHEGAKLKRSLLLPESTYQSYRNKEWRNVGSARHLKDVDKVENTDKWEIDNVATIDATSVIEIRGRAMSETQLLPRLDDTGLIDDLEASALEKNGMGTLVVTPSYGTIKYTVYNGDLQPGILEMLPDEDEDLKVHEREEAEIKRHAMGLGVSKTASARERIQAVERFFSDPANQFIYTKYLRGVGVAANGRSLSDIGWFLSEQGRSGHCEYYATSAVLMLRALGVKARYVVGYALKEYDQERKEFVIRGTHRHAWARAWLDEEERWVNVDTTPTSWLDIDQSRLSSFQRFVDRWDRWMLSWNLWRRADDKGVLWTLLPLLLAGSLLIVVVLRLVRGLRKSHREAEKERDGRGKVTLLGMDSAWFELEHALAQCAWPRQPTQSVRQWCRQLATAHPEWRENLHQIVQGHYRYRFDPEGLTEAESHAFRELVRRFQDDLLVLEAVPG